MDQELDSERSSAHPEDSAGFTRLTRGLVLLAAALLFLVRLGDRGLVSEEFRWAEVAREMVQSGDYWHPTINGQTYFDKPAGSYWLIVLASFVTGGVSEFSARLPAALAGLVGIFAIMRLGQRLYDSRTGTLAGALLATSFGTVFFARRATADMETVTGVLLAVWFFVARLERPPGPWIIALWLWMAAVSLTKGLLGFALPVAVFLVYGITQAFVNRARPAGIPTRTDLRLAQGWLFNRWSLLALPLAGCVYLLPFLAAARTGTDTGLAMVWRENVLRFLAPHNHVGPAELYLGVIFLIAAPWAVFLPAALLPPGPDRPAGDRFARVYFWTILAFFSLAASRRSYYLLPVLPPTALLIARVLRLAPASAPRWTRRCRTAGWWILAPGFLLPGLALLPPSTWLPAPFDQLPPLPGRGILAALWLLALAGVGIAPSLDCSRRIALALAGVFALSLFGFAVVYPALDGYRTRSAFLAAVPERIAPAPEQLALYQASDTVFDLGRTAPDFLAAADLHAAVLAGRVRWIILAKRRKSDLPFPTRVLLEEAEYPWESSSRKGNKLCLLGLGTEGAGADASR